MDTQVMHHQPLGIRPEIFNKLVAGGKTNIMSALQDAIELEHSTIPPYLYALYSLDAQKNGIIAAIIQSVVVEEMLHMTLACNVLNALGGAPQIDTADFIPIYPGPLPGGVESQLVVDLVPFSFKVVDTVFMVIEAPEHPQHYPVLSAKADKPITIGMFYTKLKEEIRKLDPSAFHHRARNQIGPDIMYEAVIVVDSGTACKAIDIIIDQGEGTSKDPMESIGSDEPAHYYRFAEIIKGKRLIKNPHPAPGKPAYVYGGAEIPFDPKGVWNVKPDRTGAKQPYASHTFNYTYTNLLKTLHTFFNGSGTQQQFKAALGLMMSIKQQAKDMMSTLNVGPSFQYQPINPASDH